MDRFDRSGFPTPEAINEERELKQKYSAYGEVDNDYIHAGRKAIEQMLDWKFGVRIHWSIYSVTGCGPESWSLTRNDPVYREQYEQLYKWWNPSHFDANAWCDLFSRAGLKFMVFTSRHHDGFSMFDTHTKVKKHFVHTGPDAGKIIDCDLHYSIMETPFKRDIVKELSEAARKKDLGFGLYFSHVDWFDADFRIDRWHYYQDNNYTKETDPEGFKRLIERHRRQIYELCTNYGKLDFLSLDVGFPGGEEKYEWGLGLKHGIWEEIKETINAVRRIQPEMLIRRRGIGAYGDYKTPERTVPGLGEDEQDMPWMVIYPGSKNFSHMWYDEYKPASWIIHNLIDISSKGGAFQVGYGPMPDGTWAAEVVKRLEEIGQWLSVNGEGIYGTRPNKVFKEGEDIRFTQSKDGRYVYAFLLDWPKEHFSGGSVSLKAVRAKNGSNVAMLGLDHNFTYRQDEKTLTIDIPEWFANPVKRPSNTAVTFKIEKE